MESEERTWTANWPQRLKAQLRRIGFETVEDFLRRFPGEPSTEVVKRIAPWVAAMQLERLQMQEAKLSGRIREAAIDAFARDLNLRLPGGWSSDDRGLSRAAGAIAHALTLVDLEAEAPEHRGKLFATFDALKKHRPPEGWHPTGPDDPLLQRAFAEGWPEETTPD